jgi:hypothetical protein
VPQKGKTRARRVFPRIASPEKRSRRISKGRISTPDSPTVLRNMFASAPSRLAPPNSKPKKLNKSVVVANNYSQIGKQDPPKLANTAPLCFPKDSIAREAQNFETSNLTPDPPKYLEQILQVPQADVQPRLHVENAQKQMFDKQKQKMKNRSPKNGKHGPAVFSQG